MFCEKSLGKIKFRALPKRVGPQILSLESVDYFGTRKHYWVVEKEKKNKNPLWSGDVNLHGIQMDLVMSM